jgi:hypothetical protein
MGARRGRTWGGNACETMKRKQEHMIQGSAKPTGAYKGRSQQGQKKGKRMTWGGAANHILMSLALRVDDTECAESNSILGEWGEWLRQA